MRLLFRVRAVVLLTRGEYPMNMFEKIDAARVLLELPKRATMQEIKSNYRVLIRKWHPDRCNEDIETCQEMTAKIIAAYRIINEYCKNYEFSFTKLDT